MCALGPHLTTWSAFLICGGPFCPGSRRIHGGSGVAPMWLTRNRCVSSQTLGVLVASIWESLFSYYKRPAMTFLTFWISQAWDIHHYYVHQIAERTYQALWGVLFKLLSFGVTWGSGSIILPEVHPHDQTTLEKYSPNFQLSTLLFPVPFFISNLEGGMVSVRGQLQSGTPDQERQNAPWGPPEVCGGTEYRSVSRKEGHSETR